MPNTLTATESSGDMTGLVLKTETTEAFTEISAPAISGDVRSYRLFHTDGKYTLVTEKWENTPGAIYSGEGNTSSEDIVTHPSLKNLTAKQKKDWTLWKQNPKDPDLQGWDPSTDTDPLIQKLFGWYTAGVTTYLAPRVTVKLTTFEEQPPSFNEVGIIGAPGGGFNFNGNFICTGVSFSKEGAKWRTTREYLGSQQGANWDPTIYTAQT